jgi:hypothetical protein
MGAPIEEQWRQHFAAYEDALASFYSLQDATRSMLEQSYANRLDRLAALRMSVLDARRQLRAATNDGRVAEIERERAAIHIDGVPFHVMDLVGNRAAPGDTVLELSFRVDPKSLPLFVNLTGPVQIRFPFGQTTFVAAYRLVHFRLVGDEFAFRFATVDPA